MIFEINLLKDRIKHSKKKIILRVIIYVELFLFILTYVLLFSYRTNLNFKLKDTQRSLEVLNEDIIFLSSEGQTRENLREIDKKYTELADKLNTVNRLTADRTLFSHKLKGISKVLPENMWIDKFYVKESPGKKKEKTKLMCLSGFVMAEGEEAFKRVQSFIRDLEREPLFKDGINAVQLSSISKPRINISEEITEFEIICNLTTK